MDIEIIDNFMPKKVFEEFQSLIKEIPWYTSVVLNENATCDLIDNFMLTHNFYAQYKPQSQFFSSHIAPLLSHMQVRSLIRVRANLTARTEKIIKHGFHIDYEAVVDGEVQETHNCFTSILYLNTNDGYTEFENGTKIESIENRLLLFDSSKKHNSTSCTDAKVRVNINFNYF